jgi:hypothetical protein
MSNPNHDERGRFSTGESVSFNNYTPKSGLVRAKGTVLSHIGTEVQVKLNKADSEGRKILKVHQDFLRRDQSAMNEKFRQSVKLRDKQIAEAHVKAAAQIKAEGHTGQAEIGSIPGSTARLRDKARMDREFRLDQKVKAVSTPRSRVAAMLKESSDKIRAKLPKSYSDPKAFFERTHAAGENNLSQYRKAAKAVAAAKKLKGLKYGGAYTIGDQEI